MLHFAQVHLLLPSRQQGIRRVAKSGALACYRNVMLKA
jgi:hypothetical protein